VKSQPEISDEVPGSASISTNPSCRAKPAVAWAATWNPGLATAGGD